MASTSVRHFKRSALIAAVINGIAALLMLVALRDGLLPSIDINIRVAYINDHPLLWKLSWCCWIFAAISLIYFFIQWGLWLDEHSQRKNRTLLVPGVLIGCLGLAADTIAEILYIAYIPQLARALLIPELERLEPFVAMMTGFLGNGLYCIGGLFLTTAALKSLQPVRRWFAMSLPVWIFGLGLSWSAFTESAMGMQVTTALTMTTFIIWAGCIGFFFPNRIK